MPRDWLAIRVELLRGRGMELDPPPGRIMLVGPQHTFEQLAEAINLALARWDIAHLHEFALTDGSRVGFLDEESDLPMIDHSQLALGSVLKEGDEFTYVFDFGDDWTHRCRVVAANIDPREEVGTMPRRPLSMWGWGWIPDQYGRENDEDGWEPQ